MPQAGGRSRERRDFSTYPVLKPPNKQPILSEQARSNCVRWLIFGEEMPAKRAIA
jgi:hypothetical protein